MKRIHPSACFLCILMLQACYKDPVANFDYSYVDNLAPADVEFQNLSAEADKYAWDFGDGENSNVKDPVHIFYNWNSPRVTLTAIGRGGENMITKTVEMTSYYVRNSSDYSLFDIYTYYWDGSEILDGFDLGDIGSGYDTETVITTHDEIWVAFKSSDGTLWMVDNSFLLPEKTAYYLPITNETTITEVTSQIRTVLEEKASRLEKIGAMRVN